MKASSEIIATEREAAIWWHRRVAVSYKSQDYWRGQRSRKTAKRVQVWAKEEWAHYAGCMKALGLFTAEGDQHG